MERNANRRLTGAVTVGIGHDGRFLQLSQEIKVPSHRPIQSPCTLASEFGPQLPQGEIIYPALAVMAMGWQSACGILQHTHHHPCFLPPPLGARHDPNPRSQERFAAAKQYGPITAVIVNGVHRWFQPRRIERLHKLGKFGRAWSRDSAVAQGVGRVEVFEASKRRGGQRASSRGSGMSRSQEGGSYSAPLRQVASELLSLSAWFKEPSPRGRTQFQIEGGRWVRAFQLHRGIRCVFSQI